MVLSFAFDLGNHYPACERRALLKIGDVINVAVTDVQNYGAYVVAQDQQTGFIDACEFSWIEFRCDPKMPQDVLSVGQMTNVKILGFRSDGVFSASIKRLDENANPWLKMTHDQIGKQFEGEILSVCDWGLIVRHPFNMSVWCPYLKRTIKNES